MKKVAPATHAKKDNGPVLGNPNGSGQESNNRFMNMIGSFMGFLTRRKQAYLGKPASAIKWNADKGRYMIEGESESEEEIRAPPPKFKKQEDKSKEEEEKPKKEEVKEVSGLNAFSTVAFGGALANKKRAGTAGRGARPGATPSRPATSFGSTPTTTAPKPLEEEKREIITEP